MSYKTRKAKRRLRKNQKKRRAADAKVAKLLEDRENDVLFGRVHGRMDETVNPDAERPTGHVLSARHREQRPEGHT